LNGGKSLVQNTYERAKKVSDKIYVLTEISHAHHVKEQLSDLDDEHFIIEPARRGTASCIIAGLEKISRANKTDEPIAFIAADHYIRDSKGFAHSFKVAEAISKRDGRIVLVGAEPDYPSTGFGYIEKGQIFDEESFVFEVSQFTEKPNHDKAQQYIKSGNYLWNCGYFVASIDTFLEIMKKHAPVLHDNYQALSQSTTEEDYKSTYLNFENIAIDYALIEKTDNLLVVPASFDWMDLGSFGDLHKAVESDESGNHTRGVAELEAVENSYIHNATEKPVAVIGLDNVVIVNTADGLLVARKDLAQKIGDVSKRINGKAKNEK
jgi:mannose-1-phosphate guanylyltransferase/mannose-6-phosphate isomerase